MWIITISEKHQFFFLLLADGFCYAMLDLDRIVSLFLLTEILNKTPRKLVSSFHKNYKEQVNHARMS